MRLLYFGILVLLAIIWGSAFMFVKVVVEEVPPLTLVAGRLIMAAVLFQVIMTVSGYSWPRTRELWTTIVILGIANSAFPFLMMAWGQQHIESSVAGIINASTPLSTVLLAYFWIKEPLSADQVIGIMIGFVGVVVLIGGDIDDVASSSVLGQLAVLAGVQGFAFRNVFSRRAVTQEPIIYAAGQVLVGACIVTPFALVVDRPFDITLSTEAALAWTSLGVMNAVVSALLFFWVIRRITATESSIVGYLVPIVAVALGVVVLGEHLEPGHIIGLVTVMAGVWMVSGGRRWVIGYFRRSPVT
jgi:drug/metabolite transporter (DMT)-like permease